MLAGFGSQRCEITQRCPWSHLREGGVRSIAVVPQVFPDIVGPFQKYLHDPGIELATGPEFDFLAGGLNALSLTVRTVGSHGIQCIGNCEDSCAQRDLIALQTAGIATSVITLLVGVNDFCSLSQKGDAGDDLV